MNRRHARLGMSAASVLLGALTLLGAAAAFFSSSTGANAQFFFDDRYPYFERRRPPQYGPGPFRDFLFRDHRETPRPQPVDSSKAPAPARKPDPNAKTILVLGDSMADWLAYGLEEAFAETPELGVSRKHRTPSGLIRNEARADSFDWVQSARDILSAEKPSFIIMMIGMADRQPIRERIAAPAQTAPRGQAQQRPAPPARANEQTAEAKPPDPKQDQAGPEQQAAEQPGPATESPSIVAPEPAPSGTHRHEFRSERWAELYAKRVDDLIAVLKSKGVPVYWVGLPPVRGTRSTAEIAYLNDLFRSHAERAGIVYVDVWDGFVDENGNYAVQGPDVAGQIRRLRAGDGVHFTKHGARKLAHYVEREIQRTLTARPMTVTLPEPEEPAPQAGAARPSGPAPRAPAGPIVYLTGPPKEGQELLGGGANRPAPSGPAAEVLVKGEPLNAPAGRVDDFAWPRRPIATTSVSNIKEPETPPAPGSAAARAAPAQAPAHPSGPAAARPQQKMAQPKAAPAPSSRSSFFPFWPFGR